MTPFRIVEEVDARRSTISDIKQTDSDQPASRSVLNFASELEIAADEALIIVPCRSAVLGPTASESHVFVVVVVELDMFVRDNGWSDVEFDVLISFQRLALAFGGLKRCGGNSNAAAF